MLMGLQSVKDVTGEIQPDGTAFDAIQKTAISSKSATAKRKENTLNGSARV